MTIQELIDYLQTLEDKSLPVCVESSIEPSVYPDELMKEYLQIDTGTIIDEQGKKVHTNYLSLR